MSRVKIDVLDEQKTKMTKITKNYQKTSRTVKIFAKNTELVIPNKGKNAKKYLQQELQQELHQKLAPKNYQSSVTSKHLHPGKKSETSPEWRKQNSFRNSVSFEKNCNRCH